MDLDRILDAPNEQEGTSAMAFRILMGAFSRLFSLSLVKEAYEGILGRKADAAGLAAHAAYVRRFGRLAPVLMTMAHSEEAWRSALKSRADEWVGQLHGALRGEEADAGEHVRWTARVQQGLALGAVAEGMSCGPGHWRVLARRDPEPLATAAFLGLLGRHPGAEELSASQRLLGESGDIASFLAEIASSEAYRSSPLKDTASGHRLEGLKAYSYPILVAAYRGILGRAPDDQGLAAYASGLQQTGDLAAVLAEISRSDEAWTISVGARAASIVARLHESLGEAVPEAQLARWRTLLEDQGDIGAFVAEFRRFPLGPAALAVQVPVADEAERQSNEPARRVEQAETATQGGQGELVRAAFQGLLGRDPDPEALAAYSAYLRETGNLAAFIAEVGASSEHRKRMLLRRSNVAEPIFAAHAPDA